MTSQVNDTISPPGADLVARAAAGDRDAFATLYNEHQARVFAYLYRRTGNRALAEDLTQDTFLRALRKLDTFTGPRRGGFAAWLTVISRNILADHLKCLRTRLEEPVADFRDSEERDRSAEASALRELEIEDATDSVVTAMLTLNAAQRQVVQLRFLDGLSVPETAAVMGGTHGATKTLTFRALRKMRAELTAVSA
ncbi:RNA polymerase sigma factor [Streptomyces cadmiisoli]|uniref:RNA polymerase sigma factor n=1 Tax=Streptomyces cadmiisoli TaxID=2184053 RepID=UPI003D7595E7